MKKLFVIMFVMLAASVVAQPGGGGRQNMSAEERAKSETDRLTTLLSLSADQKAKVQAIELELQKQMESRRQNSQGNMEGMRAAMQEIQKTREEKYKTVLTADQFKTYLENREQRQRERGQGGGQGQRPRNN